MRSSLNRIGSCSKLPSLHAEKTSSILSENNASISMSSSLFTKGIMPHARSLPSNMTLRTPPLPTPSDPSFLAILQEKIACTNAQVDISVFSSMTSEEKGNLCEIAALAESKPMMNQVFPQPCKMIVEMVCNILSKCPVVEMTLQDNADDIPKPKQMSRERIDLGVRIILAMLNNGPDISFLIPLIIDVLIRMVSSSSVFDELIISDITGMIFCIYPEFSALYKRKICYVMFMYINSRNNPFILRNCFSIIVHSIILHKYSHESIVGAQALIQGYLPQIISDSSFMCYEKPFRRIIQGIYKDQDNKFPLVVIKAIIRYWPLTNTIKQSALVKILIEAIKFNRESISSTIVIRCFSILAFCISSPNSNVSQAVLNCLFSETILQFLQKHSQLSSKFLMQSLSYSSVYHWCQSVRKTSKEGLYTISQIESTKTTMLNRNIITKEIEIKKNKWQHIARMASLNDSDVDYINIMAQAKALFCSKVS